MMNVRNRQGRGGAGGGLSGGGGHEHKRDIVNVANT
jgi:hypothetical protein